MFQITEQNKSPESNTSKIDICYLPVREFKKTIRKMLIKLMRTMHKQIELQYRENI